MKRYKIESLEDTGTSGISTVFIGSREHGHKIEVHESDLTTLLRQSLAIVDALNSLEGVYE